MSRRSRYLLAAPLLVAATDLFAAGTPLGAVISVDNGSANPGNVARVRVVHGSPDAPPVDVRVDGGLAFANVPFQNVTGNASLPPGTYNVKVEPAGANGAGPNVIDANLTLSAGQDYTVIATNVLASITPTVLVDDNTSPAPGKSRVRFFHGSPDTPNVDIAVQKGPVLFPNVAFATATVGEVPAGAYDLEARVAGTTTVGLFLDDVTLEAGKVYTVYALGLLADGAADRTLYLQNNRFRIEGTWRDFQGNTGIARMHGKTDQSGYIWFFDSANTELIAKVLDGRGVNNHYWFFFGAATNLEFTLTVTDTVKNTVHTFENPLGQYASFGDTQAFPAN